MPKAPEEEALPLLFVDPFNAEFVLKVMSSATRLEAPNTTVSQKVAAVAPQFR